MLAMLAMNLLVWILSSENSILNYEFRFCPNYFSGIAPASNHEGGRSLLNQTCFTDFSNFPYEKVGVRGTMYGFIKLNSRNNFDHS